MFDNGSALGGYVDGVTSFMSFEADPLSQYEWSCIYNSPSSITLNRPWSGTNSINYGYTANVTGYAVQPFMLGIRQYAWLEGQQASAVTQPSVSALFATLRSEAGIYERSVADPVAGASYYAVQPACNPMTLASMGNSVCYGGYPQPGSLAPIIVIRQSGSTR